MGLEFNRSQVRDRGTPYAGLGESHEVVFWGIGDSDRRWEFSSGNQASTAPGTRRGNWLSDSPVGIGLTAHRGRPGGVRESTTFTSPLWEFGSSISERTLYSRGNI